MHSVAKLDVLLHAYCRKEEGKEIFTQKGGVACLSNGQTMYPQDFTICMPVLTQVMT